MSSTTVTIQRESPGAKSRTIFRPKYMLFAFIGLVFAYVLGHNESFLINRANPVWHHYEPFKWWLLPHGLAGACALLLVPCNFRIAFASAIPSSIE